MREVTLRVSDYPLRGVIICPKGRVIICLRAK